MFIVKKLVKMCCDWHSNLVLTHITWNVHSHNVWCIRVNTTWIWKRNLCIDVDNIIGIFILWLWGWFPWCLCHISLKFLCFGWHEPLYLHFSFKTCSTIERCIASAFLSFLTNSHRSCNRNNLLQHFSNTYVASIQSFIVVLASKVIFSLLWPTVISSEFPISISTWAIFNGIAKPSFSKYLFWALTSCFLG